MKKRVLYGVANYEEIVRDNGYFVDKTHYLQTLETVKNPVFLRPRRFGKSLLCSIQRCYYDLNYADRFTELFAHTWIGQNPTGRQNQFIILSLDFSVIEPSPDIKVIESRFNRYCNGEIKILRGLYANLLSEMPEIDINASVADNLLQLLQHLREKNLPPIYLIIDEYDNFANQLVVTYQTELYRQLTADNGFLKTFFKTLKMGRGNGTVYNVFITGVLPITIDDMASGFNVASFITLEPEFEHMLGFTQTEIDQLLDEIYHDYAIDPTTRNEVGALVKNQYNGYYFVNNFAGDGLYNATLVMYFLNSLQRYKTIPKHLTDLNLKTDISWVRRLTASNAELTAEFLNQLVMHNTISYDDTFLVTKFSMQQFFHKGFFPILFFYLGMLTRKSDYLLQLPNLNMRRIFIDYFNEIHQIDVSTRYTDMMQSFSDNPQLEPLFAGYWREYVSQLPEAIFQQVNENFYRTTFYELCSHYLSHLFTWHVERSYPQGRSDLEFVGKYHARYAGLRWVIEFKYFSNTELAKLHTSIADFKLRAEDTEQIAGYVEGLKAEYPEARISQFVIYCFGNQGFRVFEVKSA